MHSPVITTFVVASLSFTSVFGAKREFEEGYFKLLLGHYKPCLGPHSNLNQLHSLGDNRDLSTIKCLAKLVEFGPLPCHSGQRQKSSPGRSGSARDPCQGHQLPPQVLFLSFDSFHFSKGYHPILLELMINYSLLHLSSSREESGPLTNDPSLACGRVLTVARLVTTVCDELAQGPLTNEVI